MARRKRLLKGEWDADAESMKSEMAEQRDKDRHRKIIDKFVERVGKDFDKVLEAAKYLATSHGESGSQIDMILGIYPYIVGYQKYHWTLGNSPVLKGYHEFVTELENRIQEDFFGYGEKGDG